MLVDDTLCHLQAHFFTNRTHITLSSGFFKRNVSRNDMIIRVDDTFYWLCVRYAENHIQTGDNVSIFSRIILIPKQLDDRSASVQTSQGVV